MANLTESQAIEQAKDLIKQQPYGNWTFSLMLKDQIEDKIWGYLYEMDLAHLPPIEYGDDGIHAVLVYEQEMEK